MTTARDIITLALKEAGVLGVGQTPLAEDINDGFTYLRRMIAGWQVRRYMVPALVNRNIPATGAQAYSVGPGGNFDITPRPRQIKQAYFTQTTTGSLPISLPLTWIPSYEDYARITVKGLHSLPTSYFYNNDWQNGLGQIFFWPIPDSQYVMHIIVQQNLDFPLPIGGGPSTGLDTVFNLPEEYEEAIHYNLAVRICSGYTIDVRPSTVTLAKKGMNLIKSVNAQIPDLQMPLELRRGKSFSIFNPDGY